ncbi:unnamed protein product, partial [Didymodactylos carnosus]
IDSQFLNYRISSDRDFGDLICETQSITGDKQECIVRLLSTEQYLKNLIVMSPYGGVLLAIFLILFYCCTVVYLQKRKQKMASQTTNAPVQSSLEPSKLRDKKLLPRQRFLRPLGQHHFQPRIVNQIQDDDEEFIAADEIITVVPATHDATQQTHNALRKTSDGGKRRGRLFAKTQVRSQKYLHQQPTLMLSSVYNNSWPDVNQDEIVVEEINPYRFDSTEQDCLLHSLKSNETLTKKTTAAVNKKKHFYVKRSLLKNLFPTTAFFRQVFNRNASTGTGKKHHRHHSSRKINKKYSLISQQQQQQQQILSSEVSCKKKQSSHIYLKHTGDKKVHVQQMVQYFNRLTSLTYNTKRVKSSISEPCCHKNDLIEELSHTYDKIDSQNEKYGMNRMNIQHIRRHYMNNNHYSNQIQFSKVAKHCPNILF